MRIIDADEIQDFLMLQYKNEKNVNAKESIRKIMFYICYMPTVDNAKRGKWAKEEFVDVTCSVCGESWNLCDNWTHTFKYCPNCGAKMDLEEEKPEEEYKRENDTLRTQRDELLKMVDRLYDCCEKLSGKAEEEKK